MAFTFKIELDRLKTPKIWREFTVNEQITFHKFHQIIQIIMGWEDAHMYLFSPKGYNGYPCFELDTPYSETKFLPPSDYKKGYEGKFNSAKIKLSDYFTEKGQKIKYIYDFGDDWIHTISLKKAVPEATLFPVVQKGEGKCPPEDCGGVWGYMNMLEVFSDPKHEDYKNILSWVGLKNGRDWNPSEFNFDRINKILMKLK